MIVALLIAARPCLPVFAGQVSLEPSVVKLERRDGIELWTVRARDASVRALLERVAELSQRGLEATSAIERAPLVTIALELRPLDQVLEFALGSAGLLVEVSETSIHVRADRGADETPDQRAGLAAAAWERAAGRHPRHPIAASARLAQGELLELRGRSDAARQRYLELVESAPSAPATSEAYLRAGRIAAARGDWREASEHFRALANLPGADEYRAVARVELARSTLRLGDAKSALHILDMLDASHPCWERTELSARALVRIDALLAERRFQEALLELETRAPDFDPLAAGEVPGLRARALEGAGLSDEAARAWLLVAREELGPAHTATSRVGAFQAAARLAEESGDPLGVLYACRAAQNAGFGACVAEPERRARLALGVVDPPADTTPRAELRLAQAERWLERHELERASSELEVLYQEREHLELPALGRARLALAWTRCLAASEGIESAARSARLEREHLETNEGRVHLDRGLARLFEEHALFERAADAYQGDY